MGALRCKLIPKRMARARIVLAKADGGIHHTGQSVGLAVCRPLGCHSLVRSRRMPVCVSLTCSLTLLRSGQNALNLPAVASQQYNSTHCVKPGTTYYIKRPVACQARIAVQFRVYGSPAWRIQTRWFLLCSALATCALPGFGGVVHAGPQDVVAYLD